MPTNQQTIPQSDVDQENLSELESALDASRSPSSEAAHAVSLKDTLRLSVHEGSVPRTTHLLEVEKASPQHLRHETVASNTSVDLLEVLTRFGYDPDAPGAQNTGEQGRRLIDYPEVLRSDAVVTWLVARGVSLDRGQEDYAVVPMPPPLLETAAQFSSRATFSLLREKGAKLGGRTLHLAVQFAAAIKADPSVSPTTAFPGFDPSKKWASDRKRMSEMLPYLVDELRLDVNAMDIERENAPTGHYGTPLCYAVYSNAAAVVKWLLSKGADPRSGDANQRADAKRLASALGADKCLSAFQEWQESTTSD